MRSPDVSASIGPYVPDVAVSAIALMVCCWRTAAVYDNLLVIFLLLEIAHEERGIFLFNMFLVILVLLLSFSFLPRHQAVKNPL